MNSATKKPLPVTKPSPLARYVGDIDDDLEKYFIACNDRIDHLRKSATEMVSAEEANASPRRLYSLRRRSPTLEDIPGSRKHLHRQKSAEALNKLQIISGNPPLPRRGSANTFSSAASSSRRPLSASKSASSATILTRKDPLCDNERALGGLRAKAPKLANFFEEAVADHPPRQADMTPRRPAGTSVYAPTASFHGIRQRTRSEPAPQRMSSLMKLRQLLESGELSIEAFNDL